MPPILVAIATFNRLETTQRFWKSFVATTSPEEVQVGFVDNHSADGTAEWLKKLQDDRIFMKAFLRKNVGTARAINFVFKERRPNQFCVKLDNDVEFGISNWPTLMWKTFQQVEKLGCIGLKRPDLAERAAHPRERNVQKLPPQFKSSLFELPDHTIIEEVHHVMGTCVMYSPEALDAVGDLYQMQDEGNCYGFDDALMAIRLRLAGFSCCFLRFVNGTPVTIHHFDPGESGSEINARYTRWKREKAGEWLSRYLQVAEELKSGRRSLFWRDSFDDCETDELFIQTSRPS